MPIVYPILFPKVRNPAAITWRALRVDAISESPFTLDGTFYKHQGQRFEADVNLPPMSRDEAEQFVTFLLMLDGRTGSFLMGPPEGEKPRGTIKDFLVIKSVSRRLDYGAIEDAATDFLDYGAIEDAVTDFLDYGLINEPLPPLGDDFEVINPPKTLNFTPRGNVLSVQGLEPRQAGIFMAGDFIQIGGFSTAKLYKILFDVNSNSLGHAQLTVWPDIIEPLEEDSPITVIEPKGIFRLNTSDMEWSIDDATIYGIALTAIAKK